MSANTSLAIAILAAVLSLAVLATPSLAEEPANQTPPATFARPILIRAAIQTCRSDIARLCPNVLPGGGRIMQCLGAKPDALSADCRGLLERARSRLAP